MKLWWYDRTAMCLISRIPGIHSSLGWLTDSAGNFQTTVTVTLFFGNDPPVLVNSRAVYLPQASWTHSSRWRLLEDHMTCSKVPPICHLKGLCPQSTIETEVINKWYTKDVGPVRQIGRSLLFLWPIPTVSYGSFHRRDTRGWWDFHMADPKLSLSLCRSDLTVFTL